MNKITSFLVLLFLSSTAFAQIELGMSMGINSTDLATNPISHQGSEGIINLNLQNVEYGYQFGLYSRIKVFGIYVKPSALLNSSQVNYNIEEIIGDEIISSVKSESFTKLDIPVEIGFKLAFLRLSAGPVAHIVLNSTSELFQIKGYSQRFTDATYGLWLGAGVDIWKFRLDINYETNLSRFGDHITIDGQELSFSNNANRLLLTLGYAF